MRNLTKKDFNFNRLPEKDLLLSVAMLGDGGGVCAGCPAKFEHQINNEWFFLKSMSVLYIYIYILCGTYMC